MKLNPPSKDEIIRYLDRLLESETKRILESQVCGDSSAMIVNMVKNHIQEKYEDAKL